MQRWEYHREYISHAVKDDAIVKRLNELGKDGWELVDVIEGNNYLLKRPLGDLLR